MKKIVIVFTMILLFAVSGVIPSSFATNLTLPNTPVQIYFSPNGGATQAIIKEIDNANMEILAQAYSFTSTPIAKTLLNAKKRGVSGAYWIFIFTI